MKQTNLITKISLLGLLVLALLFAVPTAYAVDGRGGDTILIPADEVVADDLYLAGEEIIIDGTVQGDVIAAGRTIVINGVVEGDLLAAAQSVTVNGSVQDDARIAGAVLTLGEGAQVSDDLLSAGYSLEARKGSQINGELAAMGYQALLNGAVAGDASVSGERLTVNGTVSGDMITQVGDSNSPNYWNPAMFGPDSPSFPAVQGGLNLGDEAQIGGSLIYTSPETVSAAAGQVQGEIRHVIPTYDLQQRVEVSPATRAASWLMDNFRRLVALVVVGLILAWLAPSLLVRPADRLNARPLPSLGWGALILFIFPFLVLAVIVLVVVLALGLGALTLGNLVGAVASLGGAFTLSLLVVFGLVLTYLAKLVVGYLVGRSLLSRINPSLVEKPYLAVLVGAILLAIVIAIPFLGGLISFIVTLLGLGALFMLWRDRYLVAPQYSQPLAQSGD